MQKRIKLKGFLKDIHPAYPSLWDQLLMSINQENPFYQLLHLGNIVLLNEQQYLHINRIFTKDWSIVVNQANVQKFIKNYSKHAKRRMQTKIAESMVEWVVSFLEKHLRSSPECRALTIIDLGLLGKLVLSKNSVEYINGQNNWKYNYVINRIKLPRLLDHQQPQVESKMIRTLSLSLQKTRIPSLNKKQPNKKSTRRSMSASQLWIPEKKRSKTQQGKELREKVYPKEKPRLESIKQNNNRLTLHYRTQASEPESKISQLSKGKSRIYQSRSNSRSKVSHSPKSKLGVSRLTKDHLPKQRQKLKIIDFSNQSELQNIIQFIRRKSKFTEHDQKVSAKLFKNYERQLAQIYYQKKQEFVDRREEKYLRQIRIYQTMKVTEKCKTIKTIQFLSADQYQQFTQIFSLVQSHQNSLKSLVFDYIIDPDIHEFMVTGFITTLSAYLNKGTMSFKVSLQLALLLHQYYAQYIRIQERLVQHIEKQDKIIVLKISHSECFEEISIHFLDRYVNNFKQLEGMISKYCPKELKIQPFQTQVANKLKDRLRQLLQKCKNAYISNIAKIEDERVQQIMKMSYSNDKEALQLVNLLQNMKQSISEEELFKSLITTQGIILHMKTVKSNFLNRIDKKLKGIYRDFRQQELENRTGLASRLRQIITINIDHLSIFTTKQYKQSIEKYYRCISSRILFIMSNLHRFVSDQAARDYLTDLLTLKKQMKNHFDSFDSKLADFRENINSTSKMIEVQNKKNKLILAQLTKKMRVLLQGINSGKNILDNRANIQEMDKEYQVYKQKDNELVKKMMETEMIHWEDDTFFSSNMTLLRQALAFMENSSYRVLFNIPTRQVDTDRFHLALEQYKQFLLKLEDSKIQKIFKPSLTLLEKSVPLVEVFLHKKYDQADLQVFEAVSIYLEQDRNQRVYSLVKQYQGLNSNTLNKLIDVYHESKIIEYNKMYEFNPKHLNFQKSQGQFGILFISNLQELRKDISQKNQMAWNKILDKLNKIDFLNKQLIKILKMIDLITIHSLSADNKAQIRRKIKLNYERLLTPFVEGQTISLFEDQLTIIKNRYIQTFYSEKANIFCRYYLYSLEETVALSDWSSPQNIVRNTKILFEEVDHVEVDGRTIKNIIIDKDVFPLQKVKIGSSELQTTKYVYLSINSALRSIDENSPFITLQLKLINWFVFFTQQFEINLLSQAPTNLKVLFEKTIKEISEQLRYGMKQTHKQLQIAQLTCFIDHLGKLSKVTTASDYEWMSTIKCYNKFKVIKVHQLDRNYEYEFEPGKAQVVDPCFYINHSLSYGFGESKKYQLSAYVLGQPFKIISKAEQYGFRQNYTHFLNIIKKFGYFVKFQAHPCNYRSINFLHKRILEISIPRQNVKQSQALRLPIYIQYQNKQSFPSCFPDRIRNHSNPQLLIGVDYLLLLKINRYEQLINQRGVKLQTMLKVVNSVNALCQLVPKDIDNFITKFAQHLEQHGQKGLSKFCYKYFVDNFNIQVPKELQLLLDKLVQNTQKIYLKERQMMLQDYFQQFMKNNKQLWLVYGPTSHKSYNLKSLLKKWSSNKIHLTEGLKRYREWRKITHGKCVLEERYIWNIQPSDIENCHLTYLTELNQKDCEQIFSSKLTQLKISGEHSMLWKIFMTFHSAHVELDGAKNLLSMLEVVFRNLAVFVGQYLNDLQPQEQQSYQITINKDMTRMFIILNHQLYFYMTDPKLRKVFQKKLKVPLITNLLEDDLTHFTCKGISYDKIISIVKKQKDSYKKFVGYQKQIIICRKYLSFGQTVIISTENNMSYHLINQYVRQTGSNIGLTLSKPFHHMLTAPKLKDILYVIEDIYLAPKQDLTYFKTILTELSAHRIRVCILTRQLETKEMKQHITIKIPELPMDDIFKYQTKEGVLEARQLKSKKLWENGYFESTEDYQFFLISTAFRLPSQYYQKFYSRQLINTRFKPQERALLTIQKEEQKLRNMIDFNSQNHYLYQHKGQHLEYSDLEVNNKVDNFLSNRSLLENHIGKYILKKILPYCLADKIFVVQQDIYLLPLLVSTIMDRKLYMIKEINFIPGLIEIVNQALKQEQDFTLVVAEPLASSPEWLNFMDLYLREMDIVSYYQEFEEHWIQLIRKKQYIFRTDNIEFSTKLKILQIMLKKMKIIICCNQKPSIYPVHHKIIPLNCRIESQNKIQYAKDLWKKINHNQPPNIQNILKQYENLIISIVEADLIHVLRLHILLDDLIKHIVLEGQYQVNRNQQMEASKFILYKLNKIKTQFLQKTQNERLQVHQSKVILDEVMARISIQQRTEPPRQMELHHFQDLSAVRRKFLNLKDCHITIMTNLEGQFLRQVKEFIFKDDIEVRQNYILMRIDMQLLKKLIQDKEASKEVVKLYEKYNTQELQQLEVFLPFQYFKYMLNIIEQYQKIEFTKEFLIRETNEANYFYLLDISIELKKKYSERQQAAQNYENKLKIFEGFIGVLESLESIDIDQNILKNYSLHKRIKKVIRNHCVQVQNYPLHNIIQPFDERFTKSKIYLAQDLLVDEEAQFQQFNLTILKQNDKLLIYDPYFQIQKMSSMAGMSICYVNQFNHFQEVIGCEDTIACIRISKSEDFEYYKHLIQSLIKVTSGKEIKIIIAVPTKSILSVCTYDFPMLNLDFNLIYFSSLLKNYDLKKKENYQILKKDYVESRQKINKKLELVKNLSQEQLEQYLLNLEQMIVDYRKIQIEVNSTIECINQEEAKMTDIENLFRMLKENEQKIPLILAFRKLKHIQFSHLLTSINQIKTRENLLAKFVDPYCEFGEVIDCIEQSRYIIVIYDQFNKQKIRQILSLEHSKKYLVRIIIDISDEQLLQFMKVSQLIHSNSSHQPQIILFFVKDFELYKMNLLKNKCSVLYL